MPEEASTPEAEPRPRTWERATRQSKVRIGAVVAVAAAVGVLIWVLVDHTGSSNDKNSVKASAARGYIGPVAQSEQQMAAFSKAVHHPIYWMGPKSGYTYELTRTSDGRSYVRYLPPGVKANDPRGDFTIIATYPFKNSYRALKAVSGKEAIALPGGGIAAVANGYPKSVHLSFPGVNYQIEVYDPSPARSLSIALSGNVKPVS